MPAMAGGKARNLDVISKQFRPRGMFVARNGRFRMVNVPAEKLLLIEVSGSPGENVTHTQCFTLHLAEHHLGRDTFEGTFVVRAAGRVDMRVSGIIAEFSGVDPAFQPQRNRLFRSTSAHSNGEFLPEILRAASVFEYVRPGAQTNGFSAGAIDLPLKPQIGQSPFGLNGINTA